MSSRTGLHNNFRCGQLGKEGFNLPTLEVVPQKEMILHVNAVHRENVRRCVNRYAFTFIGTAHGIGCTVMGSLSYSSREGRYAPTILHRIKLFLPFNILSKCPRTIPQA